MQWQLLHDHALHIFGTEQITRVRLCSAREGNKPGAGPHASTENVRGQLQECRGKQPLKAASSTRAISHKQHIVACQWPEPKDAISGNLCSQLCCLLGGIELCALFQRFAVQHLPRGPAIWPVRSVLRASRVLQSKQNANTRPRRPRRT